MNRQQLRRGIEGRQHAHLLLRHVQRSLQSSLDQIPWLILDRRPLSMGKADKWSPDLDEGRSREDMADTLDPGRSGRRVGLKHGCEENGLHLCGGYHVGREDDLGCRASSCLPVTVSCCLVYARGYRGALEEESLVGWERDQREVEDGKGTEVSKNLPLCSQPTQARRGREPLLDPSPLMSFSKGVTSASPILFLFRASCLWRCTCGLVEGSPEAQVGARVRA